MRRQVVHGDTRNQRAVAQRIQRRRKRRLGQAHSLCTNRSPNLDHQPEAKHDQTENRLPHGRSPWPIADGASRAPPWPIRRKQAVESVSPDRIPPPQGSVVECARFFPNPSSDQFYAMKRLLSSVIEIPERVHKGDFVLGLSQGVRAQQRRSKTTW